MLPIIICALRMLTTDSPLKPPHTTAIFFFIGFKYEHQISVISILLDPHKWVRLNTSKLIEGLFLVIIATNKMRL